MKKSMPVSAIPEGFTLTEKTVAWVIEKYPMVDVEGTIELFTENCEANGRMYADWQAAFRTWVRKAVDNKWSGVAYKKGKAQDPRWTPILSEVAPYGFRQPHELESPEGYRTAFNRWKDQQNRSSNVTQFDLGAALKGIKR